MLIVFLFLKKILEEKEFMSPTSEETVQNKVTYRTNFVIYILNLIHYVTRAASGAAAPSTTCRWSLEQSASRFTQASRWSLMVVRLRLARHGQRNRAFYRIVSADSRSKRDGRHLEVLGYYDPLNHSAQEVRPTVQPRALRSLFIRLWRKTSG